MPALKHAVQASATRWAKGANPDGGKGGAGMPKLVLEIDPTLHRLLQQAARHNQLSLENECLRRLEGGTRRSRHMEALLAELRVGEAQRRAQSEG